jgi:uncharacterized protein YjbI with pentapeptide repeats
MISLLISFVAFLIIFGTAGFLWFWWAVPRDQVPPHLDDAELRRLEVQDRLRQTSYQILTALGLGATLLASLIQAAITTGQWSADYELKAAQERLTQYADAIKTIDPKGSPTANVAGITTLQVLAAEDPKRFHQRANEVLVQFISEKQKDNFMLASSECGTNSLIWSARDEAPFSLKIAMQAIGHSQFAQGRLNFSTDMCANARRSVDHGPVGLEHMRLDNLDLSGRDYSCAKMSQSHFHRSSFNNTDLRRADLRGAQLADFDTPDYPGDEIVNGGKIPEWQRYRCLYTDFKYAKLNEANFEGAFIAGADLSNADVTGANFCGADVSRVNFTNAKGLSAEMLRDACVGPSFSKRRFGVRKRPYWKDVRAQPVGISPLGEGFKVAQCRASKPCSRSLPIDW